MTEICPIPATIPDIQSQIDTRRIAIDAVGIKGLRHPIVIHDHAQAPQASVATLSFTVSLPHDRKGTHMSRFVALLGDAPRDISMPKLLDLHHEMLLLLEAESGQISLSFPYFVRKTAPQSGVASLMDYMAHFSVQGDVHERDLIMGVEVPVTSLCPCSKEISQYGAHNQRSHIRVEVQAEANLSLTELIRMLEAQASCELYGLLKRADEKHITEQAYENPKFVEDMIRDVAYVLGEDERIHGFSVEVENFESIHNHSAYARLSR
ncbi:MAG: GTP cyclohydrolase I FolE2 [Gammaproteobacteria bacterium 28-57-27]|nr:MAG: GTP cyclohydrolase I FolE2 [Gammaproteobacteria bacterium 28-57-27]